MRILGYREKQKYESLNEDGVLQERFSSSNETFAEMN